MTIGSKGLKRKRMVVCGQKIGSTRKKENCTKLYTYLKDAGFEATDWIHLA
jgi:hypothetical protein